MKSLALSFLSALLLVFSFPPFDVGLLAWVAFIPFFFALEGKSLRQAFWISYAAGFLFFLGLLHWVHYVTWAGTIVLVLYLSLYFALFGAGIRFLNTRGRFVWIPSLWVVLEFVRSFLFTGFGWGLLAYSQWKYLSLIQFSELTGAYGVSFLVMFGNVLFFRVLQRDLKTRKKTILVVIFFLVLGVLFAYGFFYPPEFFSTDAYFRASVIQGNIPQDLKWDPSVQDLILKKYETLTRAVSENHPDAIFWPETAVPGFLPDEAPLWDRLTVLSRDSQTYLLVGTPWNEEGWAYNSALFLEKGEILQRYDKLHLVPFGEFIPFEKNFPKLRDWIETGDFHPGEEFTLFKHPKGNFATLICFEDIFPDLVRRFAKESDFLVNLTNDAWFMKSSAPFQHAQASVFRAIENRRSVLRVTNTGFTCLIDPMGRILRRLEIGGEPLFVTGYQTWDIPLSKEETFYTLHGDLFAWACVIVILLGTVSSVIKWKSRGSHMWVSKAPLAEG